MPDRLSEGCRPPLQMASKPSRLNSSIAASPSLHPSTLACFGEPLQIWVDRLSGTVGLVGELDFYNAEAAWTKVLKLMPGRGDLLLDFTELHFMDCSGVRLLIRLLKRLEDEGRRVILLAPGGEVRLILELTDLGSVSNLTVRHLESARQGATTNLHR